MHKRVYRLHHAWTLRYLNPIVDTLHPWFPKQIETVWAWYNRYVLRPEEVQDGA